VVNGLLQRRSLLDPFPRLSLLSQTIARYSTLYRVLQPQGYCVDYGLVLIGHPQNLVSRTWSDLNVPKFRYRFWYSTVVRRSNRFLNPRKSQRIRCHLDKKFPQEVLSPRDLSRNVPRKERRSGISSKSETPVVNTTYYSQWSPCYYYYLLLHLRSIVVTTSYYSYYLVTTFKYLLVQVLFHLMTLNRVCLRSRNDL
jgi:hypothetical protein